MMAWVFGAGISWGWRGEPSAPLSRLAYLDGNQRGIFSPSASYPRPRALGSRTFHLLCDMPQDRPTELLFIYRRTSGQLHAALNDAQMWRDIPIHHGPDHHRSGWRYFLRPWGTENRIVVPLRESDTLRLPDRYWGLHPSRQTVETLRDKAKFAAYAVGAGLGAHVPATFASPGEASFPCVIKRTNRAGSYGVAVAASSEGASAMLRRRPWRGRPVLLQELIEGEDCVLHGVASAGRIVWHCAYRYALPPDVRIRTPDNIVGFDRFDADAAELALFERFLVPLAYDGPFNIDYRRPAGRGPVIFEINARMGTSLFRPENRADLGATIRAIAAHARPMQSAGGVASG